MAGFIGRLGWMPGAASLLLSAGAYAADPPSRAATIAAADAAAGLPARSAAGAAPCLSPPPSGEKLAGDMELASEGHSIAFLNDGGGDALVKIRHADSGKLAASFLLHAKEHVAIEGVPDGAYQIQYAFGSMLAPDCRSFTRIVKARQIPEVDEMKTEVIDDEDHSEIKRTSLSYVLSVSEAADVKPISIDAAAFNAE